MVAVLGLQGIVTNPRTMQPAHMADNLAAYDFTLAASDVQALAGLPQVCLAARTFSFSPPPILPRQLHHAAFMLQLWDASAL